MLNNLLHFQKQTCKTLPNNCPKSVSLFFVLCNWCPARLALRGRALPARRLAPARVELGAEKLELVAVGLSGAQELRTVDQRKTAHPFKPELQLVCE